MPADNAIELANGQAAKINYNVPLPSSHTGKRILKLDFDLAEGDWNESARTVGEDLEKEAEVAPTAGNRGELDEARVVATFNRRLSMITPLARPRALIGAVAADVVHTLSRPAPAAAPIAAAAATRRFIPVPTRTWSGGLTTSSFDVAAPPRPVLLLVEVYGISSFLGDYGMGKTVKTFTLFPGEETRISVKTWRSTKESVEQASSIVDSHQESAADRFQEKTLNESTDKQTQSSKENWHVEAEVSASIGFASAKVSAGGGGEYQSGREEFARNVKDSVQEHAAEASAKRELSISSKTERTAEVGEESVIERTLKNVNMRRTLNFVFRELNQEFVTKIHLKDIRVAFTNGRLNSYREVPLSGLRRLLSDYLVPERVDSVAARLIQMIAVTFDRDDQPVPVLQHVTMSADGQSWDVQSARMVDGAFPPPTERTFYRFARGALGQDAAQNQVPGVVMKESTIVMRTDSVFVEALLGQADALDEYAMQTQEAAADARTLANRREELAQSTLAEVQDPARRANVFKELFVPNGKAE